MENIPEEYIKPFYQCFELLNNSNLRFFKQPAGFCRCIKDFCAIPCTALYYLSVTVFMFMLFGQKDVCIKELIIVVPVYVVITQTLFKTAIVYLNQNAIESLIVELGEFWRTTDLSDGQIKEKNVLLKSLNFCYKAFYWMNMIGSWQYILAAVLETVFRRFIFEQECRFLLPFACYIPFEIDDWFRYILVYVFQVYCMFRVVYLYLGTEFIMITLSSHLSTEFTLLRYDLVSLKPTSKDYRPYSYGNKSDIVKFIDRHRILIALAKKLDDIFNKMIFVNLTSATVTICFFGFSAKVADGLLDMLKNILPVTALILPIFNLCYYGEMLKDSSSRIGDAAYESLWYKGSVSHQKTIKFIIIRSQRPCYLTIMKLMPITLRTFTTVMSNTWSYFSLICSIFDE